MDAFDFLIVEVRGATGLIDNAVYDSLVNCIIIIREN